jgi:VanZ family protein
MRMIKPWWPLLLWVALMGVVSSIPHFHPPARFEGWDAVSHLIQFTGFGALLYRALVLRDRDPKTARWRVLAISAAMAVLYELHKLVIPGRHTYPSDFITDLFGALAGLGLAQLICWRKTDGKVSGDQGHL